MTIKIFFPLSFGKPWLLCVYGENRYLSGIYTGIPFLRSIVWFLVCSWTCWLFWNTHSMTLVMSVFHASSIVPRWSGHYPGIKMAGPSIQPYTNSKITRVNTSYALGHLSLWKSHSHAGNTCIPYKHLMCTRGCCLDTFFRARRLFSPYKWVSRDIILNIVVFVHNKESTRSKQGFTANIYFSFCLDRRIPHWCWLSVGRGTLVHWRRYQVQCWFLFLFSGKFIYIKSIKIIFT